MFNRKHVLSFLLCFLILCAGLPAEAASTVTVKRGDTLSGLSHRYHISVSRLKSLNHLKIDVIYVGQKLWITAAATKRTTSSSHTKTYVVKRGDTLNKIGHRYHVSVSNLKNWNHLHSNKILVGQKLIVSAPKTTSKAPKGANTDSGKTIPPSPSNSGTSGDTTKGTTSDGSTTNSDSPQSGTSEKTPTATDTPSTSGGADQTSGKTQPTKTPPSTKPSYPGKGKTILLDPGHGGKDSGAVANGLREVNINWAIAQKVNTELKKYGYKVVLSHSSPSTSCLRSYTWTHSELQCRLNKAYQYHADLYLAIHANAMPFFFESYVNGFEVHYNNSPEFGYPQVNAFPVQSKRLATLLDQQIPSAMEEKNLGLISDHLYVTRMAKIPSVLVEMGYLTNSSDASKLRSSTYQQRAAVAIRKALDQYFKEGN